MSLSLSVSLSLSLWLCVRARYMLHLDLTRACVLICVIGFVAWVGCALYWNWQLEYDVVHVL
jgi:hypothetical protein